MNDRRTALIFAPYFPPAGGGLENYAYAISRGLEIDHNWNIVIVTSGQKGGEDNKETLGGLTVYRLGYSHQISNTPFSFSWFGKIKTILKTENPDLLNVHMPVPGIGDVATLLSGKLPLVVTYHSDTMHKNRFMQDVLIWFYEHGPLQMLLKRADRIICSSDFTRFNLLKAYLYKSITIPPGVDTTFFTPTKSQRTPKPSLLFVASLNRSQEHKGLKVLLKALSLLRGKMPELSLSVVGEGDMKSDYEGFARRLGIANNVEFKGKLRGDGLLAEYHRAHAFVLPSLNEAFGMVILEAMACGLPVIGTRVGGVPFIIKEGETGFLANGNNATDLAAKIEELFNDTSRAEAMAQNARERMIKEFSWKDSIVRYDGILEQALGASVTHIPRITVVASYFYPKIGGLENYAYLLAKNLNDSGKYKVSVVTSNYDGKSYRQEVIDGMTVHRLPIFMRISNTPVSMWWFSTIKKIFDVEQPDIVHIHAPVPYMADVAAHVAGKRKVVLTYHSGSMLKGSWPVDLLIGAYEKTFLPKLFKRADAVIAVSQEFAKRTFPQFASKIFFIPTGVDLQRFKATPVPVENQRATFVGRIEHSSSWKGIEPLLQAMALVVKDHPQATLELVGGGDAIDHYKVRAQELGIEKSVIFSGPLLGNELVAAYRRATMTVLPSTSDSEAFSIALIEAMASGRPIIGTNIGGTPQVIENDKNGLLVAPKDPAALAAAIGTVLSDPARARRFGETGAHIAQNFSWDTQAAKYSTIFEKLLA